MLRPGMLCRLRFILLMNRRVDVDADPVAHIVVVVADMEQNTAVESIEYTQAVAAMASVDPTGVVEAGNIAGSTLQILRTRWIFQVWISPLVPVLLDWMEDSFTYDVFVQCVVLMLSAFATDRLLHWFAKQCIILELCF